jgi:hypothetical protein
VCSPPTPRRAAVKPSSAVGGFSDVCPGGAPTVHEAACTLRGGAGPVRLETKTRVRERMATRCVTVDGNRWTVWEVWAKEQTVLRAQEELQSGWLAIHFDSQERRITPIAPGWLEWSDEELPNAVRRAKAAPARLRWVVSVLSVRTRRVLRIGEGGGCGFCRYPACPFPRFRHGLFHGLFRTRSGKSSRLRSRHTQHGTACIRHPEAASPRFPIRSTRPRAVRTSRA